MKRLVRSRFTPEEDRVLYGLVIDRDSLQWNEIAKKLPGRNARQCRDRWNHYLAASSSDRPWTSEEDLLLTRAMAVHSKRWALIAKLFHDRTDSEIYRRWMLRSMQQKDGSSHPPEQPNADALGIALEAPFEWQFEEAGITKYYD
jgi:hypothetical protein